MKNSIYFTTLLTGVFSWLFFITAHAQDDEVINESALLESLAVNVEKLTANYPGVGVSALTTSCMNVDESSRIDFVPGKASKRKLTGEELYLQRKPAVLMIGRYYNCGRCHEMHTTVMATGAVISPDGLCVTNYHVLDNIINPDSTGAGLDSIYFVGTSDGTVYPITEVLAYNQSNDVAVFKIETGGKQLPFIPLSSRAPVGSEVFAISHPRDNLYYLSKGIVARYVTNRYGHAAQPTTRMDITADYAVGSSGGPILDEFGNLVGLVSSTRSLHTGPQPKSEVGYFQMSIKSAVPVASLWALLDNDA